jgi:hypothetical protein
VVRKGYKIARYPLDIGRYHMAKHSKEKPNPHRFRLLNTTKSRIDHDGVNNLKYEVVSFTKNLLYTKIIVNYDEHLISNEFKQNNSSLTTSKNATLTSSKSIKSLTSAS